MIPPNFDTIPDELKALTQWVLWAIEERDGKLTKVPYSPWGSKGDSTDPRTWSAFATVVKAYKKGGYDGIGFVLRPPYVGLDCDKCVLVDDTIKPRAEGIVKQLASYSEKSPSGKGIHVIARGKISRGRKKGDFEMYQIGRYFTMTGDHLPGTPATIEERLEEITAVYEMIFGGNGKNVSSSPSPSPSPQPVALLSLTDDQIISLASEARNGDKFLRLMAGDTSGYPSESEGDGALAAILAFYSRDQAQICRIIQRSRLWDEKWERPDYQERTIGAALELVAERYSGDPGQEKGGKISAEELEDLPLMENPRLEICLESDNFLCQYMDYASLKSDAYREYHYASALFMISTAIERKVVLARRQGTVYPNLWLFCLGDSTISRKTTALREPVAILDTYEYSRRLPGSFSPEALIEALADCPRAYLIKDEAGSLLASLGKKYMEETRDFFADIFECGDYYRKLRTGQRKEKREFRIVKPYVTQLLATTPDNFREYTSLIDLTSGWLLRYIYFYPTHAKTWKPFEAANDDDFSKYMAISMKYHALKEKLAHLELEGLKLNLTPDGWAYFAQWQRAIEEDAQRNEDNLLKAVAGRLMTAALKLAVVFTVARSDFEPMQTKEVSLDHIREAARQVESYFLPIARIVTEEVARSEKENLQNQIIGTLRRAGGVLSRRVLLRKLHAKLRDVAEAIEALTESGELEVRQTEGKGGYQVVYILTVTSVPSVSSVPYVPSVTGIQDNSTRSDRDKFGCLLETPGTLVTDGTLETPVTPVTAEIRFLARFRTEYTTQWPRGGGRYEPITYQEGEECVAPLERALQWRKRGVVDLLEIVLPWEPPEEAPA